MTSASNTTSRKTGNHLLALYAAINHMVLRAWCAMPSSWCRATVRAGARHTTKQAGNLPDSEVFSRSEFEFSGLGVLIRKDGSATCFACLHPAPPDGLDSHCVGFQFNKERETMTTSPVASRSAAPTTTPDLVQLHLQACNALAQALHTLRNSECTANDLHRAIGRTLRAGTALKRMAGEVAA